MFVYEKKLQYPVKIKNTNPKLAAVIISQYGGPDGELGASKSAGFDPYFVDHTAGFYPTAASGFPWSAASMAVKGDLIADLTEDLAADAAICKDNIDLCCAFWSAACFRMKPIPKKYRDLFI